MDATTRVPTYEDFARYMRAVNHVQELLERTTRALDAAGLAYAVIGGNAVAAWVSTIDPQAVRTTKDVDLLIRRMDFDQIAAALRTVGLVPTEVFGVWMFVEEVDPSPRRAVHLLFADERLTADDPIRAPRLEGAQSGVLGFRVIPLLELVQMKLQAYRLRDQTHLVDLLALGLIDAGWKDKLPAPLQARFQHVLEQFEREERPGSTKG